MLSVVLYSYKLDVSQNFTFPYLINVFFFQPKKHNDTGDCTDMNNGSETDEEQTSSQRDEVQQLAY